MNKKTQKRNKPLEYFESEFFPKSVSPSSGNWADRWTGT